MLRKPIPGCILPVILIFPAFCAEIPVANISISADFPANGLQEIAVANDSGANGCSPLYPACDNLAIEYWTLTVTYTSSYYNGSGPALPSPYTARWSTAADDILPSSPATFDLDLCGSDPVAVCNAPTTTITGVEFTGTLSQSSFSLYDSAVNGGLGGPGAVFFADTAISGNFAPTVAFPGDYYESFDVSASDSTGAPEPGTLRQIAGALAGFLLLRIRLLRIHRFC